MQSKRKTIKVAAIAALIIIPVFFVVMVARAKWVHKKLNYYSIEYTGPEKEKATHTVGNIVLTDQDGKTVTMDSFKDQILLVNIFFATCPEVCPEMNDQLSIIAGEYFRFKNIKFLSVSIDPESDSVPVLKQYSNRFTNGKLPNWKFCTGAKSEIYDWVTNDVLLANEMKGSDFIHDDKLVLIDKEGYIRAILPTRPPEETPVKKRNKVKLDLLKAIRDDIDNLLYEYREKDMDK